FEKFVRDELLAAGLDATGLARYDAANPAYMSGAGLLRYWTKKLRP
ncbi:MAG: MBL fold metallo-hydrolase, partial [Saprospiraceae bacterium]|nr:MBL fold metallo-hydrolase [Saprospiraceae bacterium]